MNYMQHIHTYHIVFGIFALVQLIFIFGKWKFISQALSENTTPSSLRLSGFLLVMTVIFCEVWHTMKSGVFDTTHLLYLLVAIAALFGIIKASQVIAFKNGQKAEPDPAEDQPTTNQ